MPLKDVSRRVVAEQVEKLPAPLARLYSNYALRTSDRPKIVGWTLDEARARESDAFQIASLGFSLLSDGDTVLAANTIRRAAEILEWLQSDERDDDLHALCVLLYQISGFPAIAKSIASLHDDGGLLSAVSSGDFRRAETAILRACGVLGSDPLTQLQIEEDADFFSHALVSATGVLIGYMRWGDVPRMESALDILADAAEYHMHGPDRLSWALARSFSVMASRYYRTSMWTVCKPLLAQLSPAGRSALNRYIREAFDNGRALAWPSQELGISALTENRDFAMCTPTGSGKTTIAELAIIQALFSGGDTFFDEAAIGRLAFYIVPSRALAYEVERRLHVAFSHAKSFPVQIVSSYGGSDVSPLENWFDSQRGTVIVCTQEKADAFIRSFGSLFLGRLRLMIVDEAHAVQATTEDVSRPFKLESLIARLRALSVADDCRVVGLSAVLSDASALTRWISPENEASVTSSYRSTRQVFGRLTMDGAEGSIGVQYDMLNGLSIGTQNSTRFRPNLRDFIPTFTHARERIGMGPEVQLRALALWTSAHLASTQRKDSGSVLITVGSQINHYAKDFISLLDEWDDLPVFFDAETARTSREYSDALAACNDYFGMSSFEYRLLTRGVVVHHGKLPLRMTQAFTRLIENKIMRVVLATSTLSEGVNLPFETILFPSLRGPAGSLMTGEYIRNVVGRAGRPGAAREGRALVLLGTGRRFTNAVRAYRQVVDELSGALSPRAPESALQKIITGISLRWRALEEQNNEADFCNWLEQISVLHPTGDEELDADLDQLDQFIVSALTELNSIDGVELSGALLESKLQAVWRRTFAFATGAPAEYENAFMNRAKGIAREYVIYPDIRRSYSTSLGPRASSILFNALPSVTEYFGRAYNYLAWDDERRMQFVEDLLTTLRSVPDFDFKKRFKPNDPDWRRVLKWWMLPGSETPNATKIGQWYSLANKAFAFMSSWAIGSAMLSILPDGASSDIPLAERLSNAGIPWLCTWLRDMLAHGCLDPVQAALFGAGLATTRAEAKELSSIYYLRFNQTSSDDVLSSTRVMSWLQEVRSANLSADRYDGDMAHTFPVYDVADTLPRQFRRVWPDISEESTLWRDISGYPIAKTAGQLGIDNTHTWDFIMNEQLTAVSAQRYL